MQQDRRKPTIRSRIITLIAIILAPMIALIGWLAWSYADAQRRDIELRRADVVRNLTFITDRELSRLRGTLLGLATSEDLVRGSFTEFKRHARNVASQPHFLAIRVFRESGQDAVDPVMNAPGVVTQGLDTPVLTRVFSGDTVVSDMIGSTPKDAYFYLAVPVKRNNKVAYALAAAIEPALLNSVFAEAGMMQSWIAAIVDGTGKFAARSLNPDAYVGALARPELIAAAQSQARQGTFDNITHEGVRTGNAFAKSSIAPWTAVVAVPRQVLTAPMRRTLLAVALGGLLGALVVVGVASVLAARISGPVRGLSASALALVEGQSTPDVEFQIAELDEVRSALLTAVGKTAHFAAIIASSTDAIISLELDGRIRSWNQGAENLFGFGANDIIGQPMARIVPGEHLQNLLLEIGHVRSAKDGARLELTCLRQDQSSVAVELNLAPICLADGAVAAVSAIAHDISERKANEQYQKLLMRELTHRSKNLLSIVQSMAAQTARSSTDLDDFRQRFTHRLRGLAASHDLLVRQNWSGAPLADLVKGQIENFIETDTAIFDVEGPDVVVSTRAAQAIGLALHELATNSLKYGALSAASGMINIRWALTPPRQVLEPGSDMEPALTLTWQEIGGPSVTPPARKGFGTFVVEQMAAQATDGRVSLAYKPSGLVWTLEMPASQIIANEPRDRSFRFETRNTPI